MVLLRSYHQSLLALCDYIVQHSARLVADHLFVPLDLLLLLLLSLLQHWSDVELHSRCYSIDVHSHLVLTPYTFKLNEMMARTASFFSFDQTSAKSDVRDADVQDRHSSYSLACICTYRHRTLRARPRRISAAPNWRDCGRLLHRALPSAKTEEPAAQMGDK